mmetsp:Transcript_26138/g.59748  ORF Transcript_26138/g.59748 Transcript_26138/m.59748 type:complete len:276 (-) Transcript_26138:999-1826(-)
MLREGRPGVVSALSAARADHPALLATVAFEFLQVRNLPAKVRYVVSPEVVLLEVELPEADQLRKGLGRGFLEVVVEDGEGTQGREGAELRGETAGEVVVPESEDLDVPPVAPPGPDYVVLDLSVPVAFVNLREEVVAIVPSLPVSREVERGEGVALHDLFYPVIVVGREPHAVLEGEPVEGFALRRHGLDVEDAVLGRALFHHEAAEGVEPVLGEDRGLVLQLTWQPSGVASHFHNGLLLSLRRLVELNFCHLGRRELLQAEVLKAGRILALFIL